MNLILELKSMLENANDNFSCAKHVYISTLSPFKPHKGSDINTFRTRNHTICIFPKIDCYRYLHVYKPKIKLPWQAYWIKYPECSEDRLAF